MKLPSLLQNSLPRPGIPILTVLAFVLASCKPNSSPKSTSSNAIFNACSEWTKDKAFADFQIDFVSSGSTSKTGALANDRVDRKDVSWELINNDQSNQVHPEELIEVMSAFYSKESDAPIKWEKVSSTQQEGSYSKDGRAGDIQIRFIEESKTHYRIDIRMREDPSN